MIVPMLINILIAGCACFQVLVAADDQQSANNSNKPLDDKDLLKVQSRNLNHYTRRPTRRPTKKPTHRPTRRNGNIFNDDDAGISAGDSFRLKLYWQSSYRWQNLSTDPRFCMRKCSCIYFVLNTIKHCYYISYYNYIFSSECDGSSCRQGDNILIQRCGSYITQQFVASGLTIRPASDTSLCFTIMGYSSARDTDGNIITEPIQLQECNGNSNQEFNGYQSNGQFELTPKNRGDRCLGTAHHPKSSEKVHPKSCEGGRRATTEFWVTY